MIRSRIQHLDEYEKGCKYFFNVEKQTAAKKSINRPRLKDKTITESPDIILKETQSY